MNKILTIQYLRGIAALLVVAFHARFILNDVYVQKDLGTLLFKSGEAGVDLFFIISGFIIALSTEKNSSYKDFIAKRFFRIYPVFFVCLLIVATYKTGEYDISRFFRSAILLQSNYDAWGPTFGYNLLYPAWTLTYELYFYMIFMIAMCISSRHRVILSLLLIVMPFIILQNYFLGEINLSGKIYFKVPSGLGTLKIPASPMMLEFAYGLIAYLIYRKTNLSIKKLTFISCCVIYFSSLSSGYRFGPGPINFGISAILIIAACLLYEKERKIKEIPALTMLGEISYSLYLVHTIVLELLIKYDSKIPIYSNSTGFTKFTLFILISLLLSLASYKFIEKPMVGVGRKLMKKYAA